MTRLHNLFKIINLVRAFSACGESFADQQIQCYKKVGRLKRKQHIYKQGLITYL